MTKSAHRAWSAAAALIIAIFAPRAATAAGSAVTEDEARAFVTQYEAAVNARDAVRINAAIDPARLIARAHRGMNVPPSMLEGFSEGIHRGLDWGRSLAQGIGDSGHYRLLRLRMVDGTPHALLRLVNAQGGLNYHDVLIERADDDRLVIADVHIHLSGELLSTTLGRSLRQIMAATRGGDRAYLDAVDLLETMTAHARAGEYADALETYERMPPVMQRDKTVLVVRITSAAEIGNAELDRACGDFRQMYPDDPCVDLLTIDRLILGERWKDAIAAFDRIDRVVGGDPYIDDLRANVHLRAGDPDMARKLARRAIDRDPTLDAGYWTLLEIALRRRDHEATARLLSTLEDGYGWRFDGIAGVDEYAEFVASPAYAQWQASRQVDAGAG